VEPTALIVHGVIGASSTPTSTSTLIIVVAFPFIIGSRPTRVIIRGVQQVVLL
jgi:hypothetical protein